MSIGQIFTSEIAVKVFYAYLAVSLGNTGVQTVTSFKPDVIETKIVHMEKRLERMENMIIDIIKNKHNGNLR